MSSGLHDPIFVPVVVLQDPSKSQCLSKINNTLLELENFKKKKIENSRIIIDQLNNNLNSLLKSINNTRIIITQVKKLIIADQTVNKELVSQITKIQVNSNQSNSEEISVLISKSLELGISLKEEQEDKFVFFAKYSDQYLHMIDLNTLTSSIFLGPQNYWYYGAGCWISHNKYFISGGDYFGMSSDLAVIINLENHSHEFLPSDSPKSLHSCIAKDGQIYVFGGRFGDQFILESAVKFDLELRTWSALPPLAAQKHTCSSLINNKILIIPQGDNFGYVFHESRYYKNLDLDEELFYSCEKWLFSDTKLYECLDLDQISWRKYGINKPSENWSSLNIAFKRDKFIYVIQDPSSTLWRIDTETKSAQRVIYS